MIALSIGLGGYTAGAHAFEGDLCDPSAGMSYQDASAEHTHHCAEHGAELPDDSASHACPDCSHCGASHHIANVQDNTFSFAPAIKRYVLPASENGAGSYLFSLLRPPKNLV